jgi:hypothetical protein
MRTPLEIVEPVVQLVVVVVSAVPLPAVLRSGPDEGFKDQLVEEGTSAFPRRTNLDHEVSARLRRRRQDGWLLGPLA